MLSDLFIYVKSVGKKGFKCIKKRRRKCYKKGKRWLNRRCKMLIWLLLRGNELVHNEDNTELGRRPTIFI